MGAVTFGEVRLEFDERLYRRWQRRFLGCVRLGRIRTSGLTRLPLEGPALLAPNHLSWKDVPFIGSVVSRPISFIATYRLFDARICLSMLDEHYGLFLRNPFFRRLFQRPVHAVCAGLSRIMVERVTRLGAIPAKLHSKEYSLIDAVKQAFREGNLVLMFPEGTPGAPGRLNRFKPGIPKILKEYFEETGESVPVFPVAVRGTHRFFRPGMPLGLHVGERLFVRDYLKDTESRTLNAFNESLKERVFSLLRHAGIPREPLSGDRIGSGTDGGMGGISGAPLPPRVWENSACSPAPRRFRRWARPRNRCRGAARRRVFP